jgi:nicotinamide mononucleotide transporter
VNPVELTATAATIASVLLTVRRSLWQYPIGILATALFFVVFQQAHLYASAGLQIIFMGVQIYGWWFWLHGDSGKRPRIRSWSTRLVLAVCLVATVGGMTSAFALGRLTDAQLPLADSLILGLSLSAQFLLDRKIIQHWAVWVVVNILSIVVYGSQGLTVTAWLYAGLLLNTGWGWWVWRRAARSTEVLV